MATWKEMAEDCGKAAQELLLAERYRSSVSRSYYAAYCALTALLAGRIDFGYGGNNPAHEALANLAFHNLSWRTPQNSYEARSSFRRLQAARVEADYVPGVTIDRQSALDAIRDLERLLEVLEEGLK